jgi:hypothetical protein
MLARISYVIDKARVPVPRRDQPRLRKATREQVRFTDTEDLQPIGVACELHTRLGYPLRWHIYPDDFEGDYAELYDEEGVIYNEHEVLVPYSTMEQAKGKRETWYITEQTWLEAGQRFPLKGTECRAATIEDFEPLSEDEILYDDEQLEESDVDERRTRERTRVRRERSASVTGRSREQRDEAQKRTARERPSERRKEKTPSERRRAPLPTPSLSGNESD